MTSIAQWELALVDLSEGVGNECESNASPPSSSSPPALNMKKVTFAASYLCLTDLFIVSGHCNRHLKNSVKPLCNAVCDEYSLSVNSIFANCAPKNSSKINAKKEAKRIKNTASMCKKQFWLPFFDRSNCILGVDLDAKSCGYGFNQTLHDEYCRKNPQMECCEKPLTLQSIFKSIKMFPDSSMHQMALPSHERKPRQEHIFSQLYIDVYWYTFLFFTLLMVSLGLIWILTSPIREPRPIVLNRHRRVGHVGKTFYKRDRSTSPQRTLLS